MVSRSPWSSRPLSQPHLGSSLTHRNQDCSLLHVHCISSWLWPFARAGLLSGSGSLSNPVAVFIQAPSKGQLFSGPALNLSADLAVLSPALPIAFGSYLVSYSLHVLSLLVHFSPCRPWVLWRLGEHTFLLFAFLLFCFGFQSCLYSGISHSTWHV